MSRYTAMTIGFLLIFFGAKLRLVDSYTLTPRASKFYVERIQSSVAQANGHNPIANNPYANNLGSGTSGNFNSQYNPQAYNPQGSYSSGGINSWGSTPNSYRSTSNPNPFQTAGYQSGSDVNSYLAAYRRNDNPIVGSSFAGQETIQPPKWICWPVLFLGAVFVIQGALRRRR